MKVVTIVGNLGANAVRRMTRDGRELMTFSVAVNDGRDNVTWFNCVSSIRKSFDYLVKGQTVAVSGDLSVNMYNGHPDIQVNVDRIELCGKREDSSSQQANDNAPEIPQADPSIQIKTMPDGSTHIG